MIKYLCTIISLLIFSVSFAAPESTMVFEESSFNFGTIEESSGSVSHTFTFTNTGTTPFVIENVSTSCGCTTPDYTRQPILPNKTGQIKITYDPTGRPGRFSRDVFIVSNSRQNRNTLTIKGVVNPSEPSIEDDFPYQIVGDLRVSSMMANFSYVEQGQNRSIVIAYANATDKTLTVSVADITGSPDFTAVAYPSTLAPGERGSLTLTYDIMGDNRWGYISDKCYLVVNGQKNTVPITTSAVVTEDFAPITNASKKLSPEAELDKAYFDFGKLSTAATKHTFKVTNTGKSPLIIRDIAMPEGFSCLEATPITIATGASQEIEFTMDVSKINENYIEREIVMIMNIASRPMRKIRLIGYK
ncbi:MAG: DUF1573 domain-containing protein [Rikenellaceae bacterium]